MCWRRWGCPRRLLRFRGLISSLDGSQVIRSEQVGGRAEAEAIGKRVGEYVLSQGGREILDQIAHETAEADAEGETPVLS